MPHSKTFMNLELLFSIGREFNWLISIKAYQEHTPHLQHYWLAHD